MFTRSGTVLVVIAATFLAACSSVPEVPVAAGSRVEVRLYDAGSRLELALANESHPDLQDIYSSQRSDASLKLAPDQLMGQLLSSLDRAGFADHALQGATPRNDESYISVRHDNDVRLFAQPDPGDGTEPRQAYTRLKLVMDLYYSKVGSLQYVENDGGENIFGVGP